MTREEIRVTVVRLLEAIAPEAAGETLQPNIPIRDQLDIDSMDFLNFIIALSKELGVEVPEKDYPQLATLEGAAAYLFAAKGGVAL